MLFVHQKLRDCEVRNADALGPCVAKEQHGKPDGPSPSQEEEDWPRLVLIRKDEADQATKCRECLDCKRHGPEIVHPATVSPAWQQHQVLVEQK